MASLKDLIVNGVARIVGKVYSSGGFVGDLEGNATSASKVANSLSFGNKTYDGSSAQTITASDLGALTSIGTHTHTKSDITDFPTSLPANGGTADSAATANNGFNSSTTTDSTPGWGYLTSGNGYSNGRTYNFANGGGIATAEKDGKSSLQVDGDLYVHEGLDKVATLNDIPTSLPANGGTADSAINDSNGNNIANTYMPKSGGTFSGGVTFEKPTYCKDEIHASTLFPVDNIDSQFGFYKDTDFNVDLPRIYSNNCGEVFNNNMCLRYYTVHCSNKYQIVSNDNLDKLTKLFASMYPTNSSEYATCVSIHGPIYIVYTDNTVFAATITNYGFCELDTGSVYVQKNGSVYVSTDVNCNYHVLYTSNEEKLNSIYDAYILVNAIFKKNISNIKDFSCRLHYVLAEHL